MTAKDKRRCEWVGDDPLYIAYHDEEWGVPVGRPSKTDKPSSRPNLSAKISLSSLNVSTDMSRSENPDFSSKDLNSEQELPALKARRNDKTMFEFLTLESAQAGLSWLTILKRREGYRRVFHEFDAERVARMSKDEIQAALLDPGIIRNRLKVYAAVKNAKVFMEIQKEYGSFSEYLWSFVGGAPIKNSWKSLAEVPAFTKESDAVSKDLKKRGMSFVGSTIMYAHMQATGLVNDHIVSCFRYNEV